MLVHIRPLRGLPEIKSGLALYQTVFELAEHDPAPSARLLRSLERNGGLLLGAFHGTELVGFSYGFIGQSAGKGKFFYYMELLVIRPDLHDRGIGRQLMQCLGREVAARGLRYVRWAFDPLRVGNGHFYLNVIGARGRWFVPNYYGLERFGRDRDRPTDRVIVEWDVHTLPVQWPLPSASLPVGVPVRRGHQVLVAVPGESELVPPVERRLSGVLRRLLDQGLDLVACDRSADGVAVYRASSSSRPPRPGAGPRHAPADSPGG